MGVFWVVVPCSPVEVYQRFRGPCRHHHQGDLIARTSETLVNFYQTTRRYNPEDSHLRIDSINKVFVTYLITFRTRYNQLKNRKFCTETT
jgi:hypothetical protein